VLSLRAETLSSRAGKPARGLLRSAFYGRVSTEDWQDPVTPRARQVQQAMIAGCRGRVIVAEFFRCPRESGTFASNAEDDLAG
jgi:hypothetical protein